MRALNPHLPWLLPCVLRLLASARGAGARSSEPAHARCQRTDWSPDGQWILASAGGAELINYSTGLVLPLRFSYGAADRGLEVTRAAHTARLRR